MKWTLSCKEWAILAPILLTAFIVIYYYPVYLSSYYHHDDVILALSLPGKCQSYGQFDFLINIGRPLSPWYLCFVRSLVSGIDPFSHIRIVSVLLTSACGYLTYLLLRATSWKPPYAFVATLFIVISPAFLVYNFWIVSSYIMIPYICAASAAIILFSSDHVAAKWFEVRSTAFWYAEVFLAFLAFIALVVGILFHPLTLSIFVAFHVIVALQYVGHFSILFGKLIKSAVLAMLSFVGYSILIIDIVSKKATLEFSNIVPYDVFLSKVVEFWSVYWPHWSISWLFVATNSDVAFGGSLILAFGSAVAIFINIFLLHSKGNIYSNIISMVCFFLVLSVLYMGAGISSIVTNYPVSIRHTIGMVIVGVILATWSLRVFVNSPLWKVGSPLRIAIVAIAVSLFLFTAVLLHNVLVRDMVMPAVVELNWVRSKMKALLNSQNGKKHIKVRVITNQPVRRLVTDELGATTLSFPQDVHLMIALAIRNLGYQNVKISVYLEGWSEKNLCCNLSKFIGEPFRLDSGEKLDASVLYSWSNR